MFLFISFGNWQKILTIILTLMTKKLLFRELYTAPVTETEEMAPDILCESASADLEIVEEGEPWTF